MLNLASERSPLLGKGGVAAPSIKYPAGTLFGADGVVRSTTAEINLFGG
jgi:hypothetical protein